MNIATLLDLASTATFRGTALVIKVLRVARVAFIVAEVIVAAATAAPIAMVPTVVDPLMKSMVVVHPVTPDVVASAPNTVMFAGTGT